MARAEKERAAKERAKEKAKGSGETLEAEVKPECPRRLKHIQLRARHLEELQSKPGSVTTAGSGAILARTARCLIDVLGNSA